MFVHAYHEATKHHVNRFAASLGYLDWATQPDPFRRFAGAREEWLPRAAPGGGVPGGPFAGHPAPVEDASVGELLRCSMGLSAWKQIRHTRWALRVNPSSGNLHPTEAYVIRDGRVCHYAPREHALEERCRFEDWPAVTADRDGFLVALTSIHWREAWKYGERAFRYCQHDAGHALAALRCAAAMLGWQLTLLPAFSAGQVAALTGIDRDEDYEGAEREEPVCIAAVTPGAAAAWRAADPASLAAAARQGTWSGRANRLSSSQVIWPAIDRIAEATRLPGVASHDVEPPACRADGRVAPLGTDLPARATILRRRSAVAFDARSSLPRATFLSMLRRLRPHGVPWDALWWPPQVHLVLFVHRVDGLAPGIYAYLRSPEVLAEWRASLRQEFLWEPVTNDSSDQNESNDQNDSNDPNDPNAPNDLFLLAPLDVTWIANRVSCDQDIASDGFFSLAMIARFDAALAAYGDWFYRCLFWECGAIGQVLYLEAEAAGARGTGIGCFYDDEVHDTIGLTGTAWQSLYHFSMGIPVEDPRLMTEPGYPWEA